MRIPTSTYRLQLSPELGFAAVAERLDYLERLGVTDLYLSPIFEAREGSTHGYDVVDPTTIREALGGEAGFRALAGEARERDLGILLDIVPNHMAADRSNPWWRDVLTHGRASRYAEWFDIDWDRPAGPAVGKVVLPVLGTRYVEALNAGEIAIAWEDDGFVARYHDRAFPLDPATWARLFRERPDTPGPPEPLLDALYELSRIPGRDATDRHDREERARLSERWSSRVAELVETDPAVRDAIQRAIARHDRADVDGLDRLDSILIDQPWWLVHWTSAAEEINYRRFFTINDLVGVRVEREEVFRATHAKLRELIQDGLVTGVRVDHVDGLNFPARYLERLQALHPSRDLYVVVEKILVGEERLPERWSCAGTTGYDFLGRVDRLAVDPDGLRKIEAFYGMVTGTSESFHELAYRHKWSVAVERFTGELKSLAAALLPHARRDPRARDVTAGQLGEALVEVTACLPVYRTYMCDAPVEEHDRRALDLAFAEARARTPDLPGEIYDVLWTVMSLEGGPGPLEVCRRWQQLSGAIMAKGVEDAAFYAYNPLIALNEVGTDPAEGALSVEAFHAWATERAERWPHALNATDTHDSKRSADVRARIASLSWRPEAWAETVERWRAWNQSHSARVGAEPAPSPAREVALYQTLLGAWPDDPVEVPGFLERLRAYLPKAIREASVHSDWEEPDAEYERAVVGFADAILANAPAAAREGTPPEALRDDDPFLADFLETRERVARDGFDVSIAWTVLKACAPGVPDVYQGGELVRLSLVDPDNRRPVDWDRRERLLASLVGEQGEDGWGRVGAADDGSAGEGSIAGASTGTGEAADGPASAGLLTLAGWPDAGARDRVTLDVLRRALAFRAARSSLFARGAYLPLEVEGPASDGVVTFARHVREGWAVVLARLRPPAGGADPLDGRVILPDAAPGDWRGVLDDRSIEAVGGRVELADALARLPAALLVSA